MHLTIEFIPQCDCEQINPIVHIDTDYILICGNMDCKGPREYKICPIQKETSRNHCLLFQMCKLNTTCSDFVSWHNR
jgi:hypothetical protein